MKMPVDPNEPLFPIRPNEPVCQYYMKHGTCKFGQACKFHHPPQSSVTAALVGGGAVVMNVGRKNDVPQIVMNTMSGDGSASGTPMMLQFLPQRPDEQDCIFFLKNGRCKYGATCRYHHPINFSQRRPDDGRMQRMQVQQIPDGLLQHSNVQFISQPGSPHLGYQQSSGGTQYVVTDGNVAYMTLDGSSGKGSYQPLSVVSNDGYCQPTGAPISHNQDHASSTSSIASSYDTANSNIEHIGPHTEQSSGLWNRQKNNGSHASLNAYDSSSGRSQMTAMGNRVTSDGSMASVRHRTASYGSASDSSVYVDASGSISRSSGATLPTSNSLSSMRGWRNERSPSFDNSRRSIPSQFRSRGDLSNSNSAHDDSSDHGQGATRSPSAKGRRPQSGGNRRRPGEGVDDGLSMMTSALLTMLDTPEEAAAEGYDYDYEYEAMEQAGGHMRPQGVPLSGPMARDMNRGPHEAKDGRAYKLHGGEPLDRDMFGGMAMNSPVMHSQYQDPQSIEAEDSSHWFPHWQVSKSVGRPMEGNAQSMSVMQSRHAAPNSPPHSSNVGLFLP
jgi:hypothetical protein